MKATLTFFVLLLSLLLQAQIPPSINLIVDGNSYPAGCCDGQIPFGQRIMNAIPFNSNGSTYVNYAVSGQTTVNMLADEYTQVLVPSTFDVSKLNVLLVHEVGNDVGNNLNVDSAVNRLKRYCRNAKIYASSIGARLIVITYTNIPRNQKGAYATNADFNAAMVACNVEMEADTSGDWDILVREDQDLLFATLTSAGYAQTDQIHPSDAGHQGIADDTINALIAFLKPITIKGHKAIIQ